VIPVGAPASTPAEVTAALEALVAGPPPLLVMSDFDGTLAEITLEPSATRIVPLARAALRRLTGVAARRPERLHVVVLSGRSSADVAGRIRVGGATYLGNHGLESAWLERGRRAEQLRVTSALAGAAAAADASPIGDAVATALGRPDWLFVEPKGPSVAFHYRQAPDPDAAGAPVRAAVRAALLDPAAAGLEAIEGRRVVEVRPMGAGGKGAATERLLERVRPGSVVTLGDDRSDAEAFAAVAAWRDAGHGHGLVAAIHGRAETPEAILEHADLLLDAPAAVARFLAALARAIEAEPPRA
jgi:trehalose-phosphatase